MGNIQTHLKGLSSLASHQPSMQARIAVPKARAAVALKTSPRSGAAALPTTIADLGRIEVRSYDLSITAAADMSIPVIGSAGGAVNRRIVVLEQTAYREIKENETRVHYGYAVRFCVTVSRWDANLKLSLPFLAASAEIGSIEAQWTLQILGLAGRKIQESLLPPTELNVEKFVLAKQSLEKIIAAIQDPGTIFRAEVIRRIEPDEQRLRAQRIGVVQTYALSCIERGRSLSESARRAGYDADFIAMEALRDIYRGTGIQDANAKPGEEARRKAHEILSGVKADV